MGRKIQWHGHSELHSFCFDFLYSGLASTNLGKQKKSTLYRKASYTKMWVLLDDLQEYELK